MKYIFLAIFVLLAAQPVPVMSCDMHDAQEMSHNESSGMSHDSDHQMDCCDPVPSGPIDKCDSSSHCASCPSGFMAICSFPLNQVFKSHASVYQPGTWQAISRTNPPPFKPPIV